MPDVHDPQQPLIRTRLAPPRIGSASVERRALLERLEGSRTRKLCALVGPAGAGKTSLLVQWRRRLLDGGARVAWFNAGPDDDDALTATYLVESLRQSGLDIDTDGLHLFQRSGGSAWQHLLAALVNGAGSDDRETYLVIDNFQFLTSFPILQLINRWIALAPHGFHFALATRVSPPLALLQLRAEDQLVEIDFGQLRFDRAETRRFVDSRGLQGLTADDVDQLQRTTDGWAAGLQLLTFSMRKETGAGAARRYPDAMSTNRTQALHDYLEQTSLDLLQPDEIDFLTRISICRRFNRALGEAVSGDVHAAAHLHKFESENLFLLPIDTDDDEPWYRFHPLFAGFLSKRRRRLLADEQAALHQRAARWFAANGFYGEAFFHGGEAGDTTFLIELIDRRARRMTNDGQYREYMRWCEKVPSALLARRINASLCLALSQLSYGRLREFARTVADIEAHPQASAPEVRTDLLLLKAYAATRADDTAEQRLALAAAGALAPPPESPAGLMLASIRAHELVYSGRYDEARAVARERFLAGEPRRQFVPLVDCWIGLSYLLEGDIGRALDQLQLLMNSARPNTGATPDFSAVISGYLVEALYQADRIDDVRALLDDHLDLILAAGYPDALLYSYRVRARLEVIDGDHLSALKVLQDFEERGQRMGLPRLVAWSLRDQVGLALEMSDDGHAQGLCHRLELVAAPWMDERQTLRSEIPLALALARADCAATAMAPGPTAAALVDEATARARNAGRRGAELHAQLARACLVQRGGDPSSAGSLVTAQLQSARLLGLRRLFADLPAPIRRTLNPVLGTLDPALTGFAGGTAQPPTSWDSDAEAVEVHAAVATWPTRGEKILTLREREVLGLIGQALSIKSVARELALSPGTVKWHLRNIYGKLGAYSKEDALAKARERAGQDAPAPE
ncbi:MAG: LuxR C-terminal-related transcriptional regulator [Sinimarinibacterium flocculans]|uniref:LuxR C-terminal-related transcriptional regulator n=1 Tax=Sinimarinibacterium flocculans TaxID=985250 RepID=UPI003C3D874E